MVIPDESADDASMRILIYCTEWDPHKGGIVAVNRSLVEGLAAAGHEVFVRVGHEVPPDNPGERIHLIGPRQYDPTRSEQEQLVHGGEILPRQVDAIIGHSRYSGPEALNVRDELYPDTPYIHVIHMVTGALARVAKRPDLEVMFEGIERRMTAAADMVVGVGPVLTDEARRLADTNPGSHYPAIHQIIPGVPFEEQRLVPWNEERTRHVLLVGRADAPQKGAHHAALMVRRMNEENIDVQLTVRGAAPETVEQVKEHLSNIAGREVVVKPFSIDRDEILDDLRNADVLVMPSQAEGFGLVGLEAAGAGLPVLLPTTSGVGAFLGDPERFPRSVTQYNLVQQGFEEPVSVQRWTDQLRNLLGDIPEARKNALVLQQLLREANTTWVRAAESLATAVRAMPDRRASRQEPSTVPTRDAPHYPLPPPPLGSQERITQQRLGEALLSNDGRITDTSQAKTIAIQALADRMRTSTPELTLAAFGLTIGTDMAHRLGDGHYVLVAHNEMYPSLGADVLHVDELDPANLRHISDKMLRMDDPRAEVLIRQIAVSELMGAWAYGSNNNVRVLALQEAAEEEFQLTNVLKWQTDTKTRTAVDLELDYNRHALRDFLRSQYILTQEAMAARGVTEVVAYRALTWGEGVTQPDWAGLNIGDSFEARHRPLASWAADRQIVSDWLEQRGGDAVILVDRKPAQDILSMPTTGMGFFAQKEWVTLPGDRLVTLDGIYAGRAPADSRMQTAASSVTIGAPDLSAVVETLSRNPTPVTAAAFQGEVQEGGAPGVADRNERMPLIRITASLDPADPLDARIVRILAGDEDIPYWWPQDESGYAVSHRDLDFLGLEPIQIKWWITREAPMGMTPELYRRFGTELLQMLEEDGIGWSQIDVRLKGSGAEFFSGGHKALPREADLAESPEAVRRLQEWFDGSQTRPLRRPCDAMWRLGLDSSPSDIDLDFNSSAMVRAARIYWRDHHSGRYAGDFMGAHGYLDKQTVMGAFPALAEWASNWERELGRSLSLGVFESSGPFDATQLGRNLSSHFRMTDWIIHNPDNPRAWNTPRSRISEAHLTQTDPTARRDSGAVQPYSSPDQQREGARQVTEAFVGWTQTEMGQQLLNSRNQAVTAFRDAWKALPPTEAGDDALRYGEVARAAAAVVDAAASSGRFKPENVDALRAVSARARQHTARLVATHGLAADRASSTSPSPAQQVTPPRTSPPPEVSGPGMGQGI